MSAPEPVKVNVPLEYCADPAIGTAPISLSTHGSGSVGGGGCDDPWTASQLMSEIVPVDPLTSADSMSLCVPDGNVKLEDVVVAHTSQLPVFGSTIGPVRFVDPSNVTCTVPPPPDDALRTSSV